MADFHERLIEAMNIRNIRGFELAKKSGLSKAQISQYVNGVYTAKQTGIYRLASALNVSEAWLMGYDVPMERSINSPALEFDNVCKIELKKFPVLGEIACGKPIYADQDFETYIEASSSINADFCLIAKGESMINARIYDGDVVFVREQSIVNNGEIAAVVIGDEATLKRWYYYPEKQKLILNPENPAYEPLVYVGEELNEIRCLGKAVSFISKL